MKKVVSIFNDVLGPIMRGPSSSHTAGPDHIGLLARNLSDKTPASVNFAFDPGGSFGEVYRLQGSDLEFAAGDIGLELTGSRFSQVLQLAKDRGVDIEFAVRPLNNADHPTRMRSISA